MGAGAVEHIASPWLRTYASLGIFYGLLAAGFYAAFIILNKYIKSVGSMERSFYQFGIAAVVMLPYTAWGEGFHLLSLDAVGWSALAIICLIHTVIMHYAYFQALGQLTGQEVAVLGYIDPLVAVVISYFLLHETMTFSQALGGAMILGFAFWNECKGSKDLQGA